MKSWPIGFVAVIAAACPAVAQTKAEVEAAYSPQFNRCMETGDAARGITSAIMECNGAENERQNANLNQTYASVMARLTPQEKAALRTSERNWIKQRAERCQEAAEDEGGGSASGIIYSSCVLDETIKRAIWLKSYRP